MAEICVVSAQIAGTTSPRNLPNLNHDNLMGEAGQLESMGRDYDRSLVGILA